ncbi:inactive hydroxysteroid dehydrogenase-like protein 1 isoform X1 [Dendronephthya gigantea]|uniref:inactive hydroxysteroid dehydrogenase-like protein 1 isoform X1 n=1 Tax=Dendronephthya gigantea TaxID=151771 RepID=UPI00106A9E79|nr:inactive hydroxysteroid dehydrogenase-like protein 1 isoform X1 [Dendronephthya gigantea]
MSLVSNFTCLVGTLYIFYLLSKFLMWVFEVLKTTFFGGHFDITRFGEWAVVTGCTDGIGKSYAKQLAAKGLNIILMSRSKEKLTSVAAELENDYKVKTMIIQVDFSGGHEIYEPIAEKLEGFEIGVIVNNVGVAVPSISYLHEFSNEVLWKQINVNVMSAVMITRLLIPAMVERKKGVIINISSCVAVRPFPLRAAYSGTKAFLDKFSKSLQIEYGDKGIVIQSVLPFYVATNMTGMKPGLFSPAPDDYVRAVLKKVGISSRCFGYWPHELQAVVMNWPISNWLIHKFIMKFLLKRVRLEDAKKKS